MINCVWAEGVLGGDGRSRYATNTLLNTAIDRTEIGFVHRNGLAELPANSEGAVVVVHGEHMAGQVEELRSWSAPLSWMLMIIMGDELRTFDSLPFVGSRRKIWRQYPLPGKHDHEDRRLVAGYPSDCPAYLEHLQMELSRKVLDWSYMGQVNNLSRRQCVTQLKMVNRGYLYESPGFWLGLPHAEYYKRMAESKVVACPAGGAFPESLRMGEALEAGCVPIVEDRVINGVSYWKYVLGEEPPFPTLVYWTDFPRLMDQALRDWPSSRDKLQVWWAKYKAKMCDWFIEDLKAIGGISA